MRAGIAAARRAEASATEALLVAVVITASSGVVAARTLGAIGLSGSRLWLALLTVGVAATVGFAPGRRGAGRSQEVRIATGLLAGGALGLGLWMILHPSYGSDIYHLSLATEWAQDGDIGRAVDVVPGIPVSSYALNDEILRSWAMTLTRSFVPALLITPLHMVVALTAISAIAEIFAVPRVRLLAALAVFATVPAVVAEFHGPSNDLAASAWMLAALALAAAARERRGLAPFAVLAAALGIGTKATALLVCGLVAIYMAWVWRPRLRRSTMTIFGIAAIVGPTSYVLDAVTHGSPFWPTASVPWGDPKPALFEKVDASFVSSAGETLTRHGWALFDRTGATAWLVASATIAVLSARSRPAVIGLTLSLLTAATWALGPQTGAKAREALDFGLANTRFLLPSATLALLVLVLTPVGERTALLYLSVAVALNGIALSRAEVLPAGVIAMSAAGCLAGAWAHKVMSARPPAMRRLAFGGGVLASVLFLTLSARGLVERHADLGSFDSRLTRWVTDNSPDGAKSSIAFVGTYLPYLASDTLSRRLRLLPLNASCADIDAATRYGWVIVDNPPLALRRYLPDSHASNCLVDRGPLYRDARFSIYGAAPR